MIRRALPDLSQDQIRKYAEEKQMTIEGIEHEEDDLAVVRGLKGDSPHMNWEINTDNEVLINLDPTIHDHLLNEGVARDIVSRVQRLRRKPGWCLPTKCVWTISLSITPTRSIFRPS